MGSVFLEATARRSSSLGDLSARYRIKCRPVVTHNRRVAKNSRFQAKPTETSTAEKSAKPGVRICPRRPGRTRLLIADRMIRAFFRSPASPIPGEGAGLTAKVKPPPPSSSGYRQLVRPAWRLVLSARWLRPPLSRSRRGIVGPHSRRGPGGPARFGRASKPPRSRQTPAASQ